MITHEQFENLLPAPKLALLLAWRDTMQASVDPTIFVELGCFEELNPLGVFSSYLQIANFTWADFVPTTLTQETIKWLEDNGYVSETLDYNEVHVHNLKEYIRKARAEHTRLFFDLQEQYDIEVPDLEKYRPDEDGYVRGE